MRRAVTSRRTLILIAAIAIGTVAAYILWSYIQGVEDDLNAGAEQADVFMVITDIPEGTRGEDAQRTSIEVRQIPNNIKPANAVTDLAQITGKVSDGNLVTNEILKVGDFIDPSVKQTSFSDLLPEGMVTASINIDRVRAAGGFLAPGDEVNMLVINDEAFASPFADVEEGDLTDDQRRTNAAFAGSPYSSPARWFFQKVKILAIEDQLAPRAGEEVVDTGVTVTGGGIITIAAPPDAILRILSVPSSSIVFTLLPDGYEAQVWNNLTPDEVDTDILPGEDENFLTPYGPGGFDAFVDGDTEGASIAFGEDGRAIGDTSSDAVSDTPTSPRVDADDNPFDGDAADDADLSEGGEAGDGELNESGEEE